MAGGGDLSDLRVWGGTMKLEQSDPRWGRIFESSWLLEVRGGEAGMEDVIRAVVVNHATGNVLELMKQSASRLGFLMRAKNSPIQASIEQCCTGLHLSSLVFSYMCATLTGAQMRQALHLTADWPLSSAGGGATTTAGNAVLESLLSECMGVIAQNPPQPWSYYPAFSSCTLLLCAMSAQLYSPEAEEGPCMSYVYFVAETQLRAALSFGDRDVAGTLPAKLVRGLLLRSVDSSSGNNNSNSSSSSHIRSIWLILLSILRQPQTLRPTAASVRGSHGVRPPAAPHHPKSPILIAPRCQSLLLVLLHNRRTAAGGNALRECIGLLRDDQLHEVEEEEDLENLSRSMMLHRRIQLDFAHLGEGLASMLPGESAVMLLQTLMQIHPLFNETMLRAEKMDALLTALLRALYEAVDGPAGPTDNLYVLIVSALMLAQDEALLGALPLLRANSPPWYRERRLGDVSLLDLFVLCILRVTMFASFRLKDQYLTSNCYAVLLNLAPHLGAGNMHMYAAERLVQLLFRVSRRLTREKEEENNPAAPPSSLCRETLGVLLKVVGTALRAARRGQSPISVQLIYALMQERDKVVEFILSSPLVVADAETSSDLAEIAKMEGYYSSLGRINADPSEPDYSGDIPFASATEAVDALRVIVEAAKERADEPLLQQEQTITFTYQEDESPGSFFVPCAWTQAIISTPEIYWHLPNIRLFDTSSLIPSQEQG